MYKKTRLLNLSRDIFNNFFLCYIQRGYSKINIPKKKYQHENLQFSNYYK